MERYKEFAEGLVSGNNILSIYEELLYIFMEEEMSIEYCGIHEKMYNLTKKPETFAIIGNVLLDKLHDNQKAFKAYSKYFSLIAPNVFKKYQSILDSYNYNDLLFIEEPEDSGLRALVDRYTALVYITVYFANKKNIDPIAELITYLKEMKNQIDNYIQNKPKINLNPMADIKNAEGYLSFLLSKIEHHNDFNNYAIELNPENEIAYINILEDLITYNKYNEAIEFYKTTYHSAFPKVNNITSVVDICWFLSDKYFAKEDYLKALTFQKKAIDIELCNA